MQVIKLTQLLYIWALIIYEFTIYDLGFSTGKGFRVKVIWRHSRAGCYFFLSSIYSISGTGNPLWKFLDLPLHAHTHVHACTRMHAFPSQKQYGMKSNTKYCMHQCYQSRILYNSSSLQLSAILECAWIIAKWNKYCNKQVNCIQYTLWLFWSNSYCSIIVVSWSSFLSFTNSFCLIPTAFDSHFCILALCKHKFWFEVDCWLSQRCAHGFDILVL